MCVKRKVIHVNVRRGLCSDKMGEEGAASVRQRKPCVRQRKLERKGERD